MKVKVFSMVGISRYETEDETYHDVGVYGSLLEAQKAMQDNYNEEMDSFDGDLPVDLEAIMGDKTASIEYYEHCFSWDIYEHLLDAEPA